MNRTVIRLSILVGPLACALFWISPYWAIAGMAKAAQAGDAELLSDYLDLPRLKESLKGQFGAHLQSEMTKGSTTGWEALGMALGTVMIDKVLDNLLTPESLARLLQKQMTDVSASRITVAAGLVASDKSGWVNDSTFRVRANQDSIMTWRRQGLSWRLTSVTIPFDGR